MGKRLMHLLIFPFFIFHSFAFAAEFIQKDIEYRVVKGDYGGIIEGKLGIDWSYIAKENSINPEAPLKKGQGIKAIFMRIVPLQLEDGIVINIPDRTLYRFEKGKLKDYYFISAGKPTWQTPLGEFAIKAKAKDPTWFVPHSIQKEMEAEGKDVLVEVPPGSENPLGKHWLQLSIKGVGLHGTTAPQSIYKFRSHGCIRLRPEVAELFYKEVPVGTKGIIIYKPVKIIKTPDKKVLIEVYRDFYKTGIDYISEAKKILNEINALNEADWNKIQDAINRKDGIVKDVSR